jgi:hypothetical protein
MANSSGSSSALNNSSIAGFGVDRGASERPGVPMEAEPKPLRGSRGRRIPRQKSEARVFKRAGLEQMTPVFGTCQPPRGLSGLLRARAYKIPEDKAARWGLLLFADRVDVIEGLVADAFVRKPFVGWIAVGVASAVAGFGLSRRRATKLRA